MKKRLFIENETAYILLDVNEARKLIYKDIKVFVLWGTDVGDYIEKISQFEEEIKGNKIFALEIGKIVDGERDSKRTVIDRSYFVWKVLTEKEAIRIYGVQTGLEMCRINDDGTDSVIENGDQLIEAIVYGNTIVLAVDFLYNNNKEAIL